VLLRIAGIVFLCLGATLVAAGITGAMHGASMASFSAEGAEARNQPFDASTWLAHWRVWGFAVACAGGAIATGGAAVALNKRWGLLLLGIVLLIAALAPWVVQWFGLARYRFERAGLTETLVFLAFAFLAIWGYFLSSEARADA
jgi:hypothetical protein